MTSVNSVDLIHIEHAPAFRSFIDKEFEMTKVISSIQRFLTSEDGPTAVEYAVLVGLIAVGIVAVSGKLSGSISGTFSTVSSTLGANS